MGRDIAQEIIDAVAAGSPDYVITKLTQEREDKIKSQNLGSSVPTTETILKTAYAKASGGSSDSGKSDVQASSASTPRVEYVNAVDDNGIIETTVSGYNPAEYSAYSYGSVSSGAGKVAGYVIIGLLGVVLLDRLMAGGGKK